jgi:hypothetical protein
MRQHATFIVSQHTFMLAQHLTLNDFLVQNSFPMREWHVKHMS